MAYSTVVISTPTGIPLLDEYGGVCINKWQLDGGRRATFCLVDHNGIKQWYLSTWG
jgi:hypothetical protein